MFKRLSAWQVMVSAGLILLLAAVAQLGWVTLNQHPARHTALAQESPVMTPTPPSSPLPYPTPTPVPVTEVFIPAPATGGLAPLDVPIVLWEAGLGLLLIGLGLIWRRRQ